MVLYGKRGRIDETARITGGDGAIEPKAAFFFGDFGILKRLDEQLAIERREGGKVIYFSELTGAPDSLAEQEPDYWDYYTDIRCALPRDTRLYRTLCHLGLSRLNDQVELCCTALMLLRFEPQSRLDFSASLTQLLS